MTGTYLVTDYRPPFAFPKLRWPNSAEMNIIVFMGGMAERVEELEWAAGALHDAAARLRRLAARSLV